MLCYVSLPNDQCLEVQIDHKQTGQVVLDKVRKLLSSTFCKHGSLMVHVTAS